MEIPLRHGLCSHWNTKPRFIVVWVTVIFCLFLVVGGNEEQQGSKFLRNRLKKKHLLHHRLERQAGFPSLYQTYRYDQDVNIGKFKLRPAVNNFVGNYSIYFTCLLIIFYYLTSFQPFFY